MTDKACVHEELGFAYNSSWYEKHRCSTAARLQRNEIPVGAMARVGISRDVARELLYRGRIHERSGDKIGPKFRVDCGTQLNGREGVSSQVEEIVGHSDPVNLQHLRPNVQELCLDGISRGGLGFTRVWK